MDFQFLSVGAVAVLLLTATFVLAVYVLAKKASNRIESKGETPLGVESYDPTQDFGVLLTRGVKRAMAQIAAVLPQDILWHSFGKDDAVLISGKPRRRSRARPKVVKLVGVCPKNPDMIVYESSSGARHRRPVQDVILGLA
jgi:hypothetical protein